MSEYGDLSKLPDDPEYWAALEQRVLAGVQGGPHAVTPGAGGPGRDDGDWWSPLETGAPGLFATALAAVLAALLLLPPRPSATGELLLAPADPAGASIIAAPSPPALASLVFPADAQATR